MLKTSLPQPVSNSGVLRKEGEGSAGLGRMTHGRGTIPGATSIFGE